MDKIIGYYKYYGMFSVALKACKAIVPLKGAMDPAPSDMGEATVQGNAMVVPMDKDDNIDDAIGMTIKVFIAPPAPNGSKYPGIMNVGGATMPKDAVFVAMGEKNVKIGSDVFKKPSNPFHPLMGAKLNADSLVIKEPAVRKDGVILTMVKTDENKNVNGILEMGIDPPDHAPLLGNLNADAYYNLDGSFKNCNEWYWVLATLAYVIFLIVMTCYF